MPTSNVTTNAHRYPRLLAFGAALLLPLAGALAQNAIPDEMLRKQEITDSDKQVMKGYIAGGKAGLESKSPTEVKKARDLLVAPLEKNGGVSVPFRVAYANALIEAGAIDKVAASKDNDLAAANALRIAGQAATGNTLNIILEGLKDTRPQVRYAATVAARAAFVAAKTTPAISADELSKALRALADVAAKDAAKEPVDGALQAMTAARDVGIQGMRSLTVERLATAAGKRALTVAKGTDPDAIAPLLRVAAAARQDITDAGSLSSEARKAAAAFAGQLLVAIDGQWKDDQPSEAMMQAAKAAEAILTLADTVNNGTNKFPVHVGPGTREQFTKDLKAIIDILKAPPYSIPAESFTP